ncbi:site-specific DNA-methyltransferase [Faecalibacterium prausnitzii]|uniref:Site-specific DNA-methyltransferase n=1 Tax=Faecalibacterium prausnitzii TaxID=853 RepID=A0A329TX57_9FIRM|nr:site-specific DNA-methyltransferase [Faecalibacterium prausnitzii]RAW54172.1 site-specific DNA-methyltransferase [Faecalibacterium prausnitzii]
MPTLEWIGKNKVVNHHQEVPFRVLERQYSFDEQGQHTENNSSENMIIHGDNLEALKALLPQYEGKVKCIYIDPPYNTGNEGWCYNDNVSDPHIQKWLGEVVGKEGEDLTRHDKWLCMMYPRLMLLQKLLADDGVIFISIDDNELYNLKSICDEIFGASCYASDVAWQRTYSTRNDSKGIVNEVEHILVYSKEPEWNPNKLPRTAEMDAKYKNPDNDVSAWRTSDAFAPGAATHQGMVYAIQHPFTGKMLYPSNGACWRYQQDTMLEIMNGWTKYELQDLHDEKERAHVCGISPDEVRPDVKAIVLADPLEVASANAQKVLERGRWPRFFFTKGGKGGIARKTYLENVGGRLPTNFWPFSETGHTDEAKKEMLAIFDGKATFDTPKPHRLIEFVLKVAGTQDALILDSFAGSGTTAHAVLNMNKADGGHRKFILVEMGDYADTITAERVKRVIHGYGEGKNAVEGTGGSFSYYELGEPLLLPSGNLNETVGTEKIRDYIWYTETKKPLSDYKNSNPYFLGENNSTAYYFFYEPQKVCVLNYDFVATIPEKAEGYIIYADRCTLSEQELQQLGITFKKIPRDIVRV